MTTLSLRLAALFLVALSICGCPSMEVADFSAGVVLPYSEDCFEISFVTKKEVRTPAAQCQAKVKRSLFITSENYKLLRKSIQDNCQVQQCKQLVGQFDSLFIVIDKDLNLIPWP